MSPTLARRLAASPVGGPSRECLVPISVFLWDEVQLFSGFPTNPVFQLFRETGETTSVGISEALYPKYRDLNLPSEQRFELRTGLPPRIEEWLRPIAGIIRRAREGGGDGSPVILLDLRRGGNIPSFFCVETLSGQVPDGNHRVLAYTLLAPEVPDCRVRVRIVSIHPAVLAIANGLTLALCFVMDPIHTPGFAKKRFRKRGRRASD